MYTMLREPIATAKQPRDRQNMTTIHINGQAHEASDPSRNLLSFIRFDAGLTGTKYGCGEGLCGACTVIVDGQPLRSCVATVGAVSGRSLTPLQDPANDANTPRLHHP